MTKIEYKGIIADHPTPKASEKGICYQMCATDCKRGGCMVVIYDETQMDSIQKIEKGTE